MKPELIKQMKAVYWPATETNGARLVNGTSSDGFLCYYEFLNNGRVGWGVVDPATLSKAHSGDAGSVAEAKFHIQAAVSRPLGGSQEGE